MSNTLYKKFTRLVCLLCALAMLFALASCNGDSEGDETLGEIYHTITFNSNGGSDVPSQEIIKNEKAANFFGSFLKKII